jgi:hypothetical protein
MTFKKSYRSAKTFVGLFKLAAISEYGPNDSRMTLKQYQHLSLIRRTIVRSWRTPKRSTTSLRPMRPSGIVRLVQESTTLTRINIGAHQIKEGNEFDVLTVDSFGWEDVDLLQLDVEGFEHFAILGAAETIQRSGPIIVLELKGLGKRYGVEDSETVDFLAGLGYKITNRIHRDVIFTRA